MTTFIHFLKREFLSGSCYLCHSKADLELSLCEFCIQKLSLNQYHCVRCANPLQHHPTITTENSFDKPNYAPQLCGKCLNQNYYFDQVQSPFLYAGHLIKLLHGFKYRQKLFLGRSLSQLFIRNTPLLSTELPIQADIIVPIPLYKDRIRQRGFNQALELANFFSRQTTINIDHTVLKRIKPTMSQRGLSAKERKQNIKNAFAIKSDLSYKHIILVDDVMTTGNTVNEAAKVLKKAGVQRVDVWTIARA